jgi:hypothetical protein
MDTKKNVKDEVESVLLSLHKKLDSLRAKVEALCESTGVCNAPAAEKPATKDKK